MSYFNVETLSDSLELDIAFVLSSAHPFSGEAGLRTLVMLCIEDKADGGLGA